MDAKMPRAMEMGARLMRAYGPVLRKAMGTVAKSKEDQVLFWAGVVTAAAGYSAASISAKDAAVVLRFVADRTLEVGRGKGAAADVVAAALAKARSQ